MPSRMWAFARDNDTLRNYCTRGVVGDDTTSMHVHMYGMMREECEVIRCVRPFGRLVVHIRHIELAGQQHGEKTHTHTKNAHTYTHTSHTHTPTHTHAHTYALVVSSLHSSLSHYLTYRPTGITCKQHPLCVRSCVRTAGICVVERAIRRMKIQRVCVYVC